MYEGNHLLYECEFCKKVFKKYGKYIVYKFCSRKCYQSRIKPIETLKKMSEAKKGKIPWNKGIHMWEGKEHPRGTLGKIGLRNGNKCHFWKGGISTENELARKSPNYKIWRKSVFERDNYICQICKIKGGKLQADHIIPFSMDKVKRYDINNGRTLCIKCHFQTETYGSKLKKYKEEINGKSNQERTAERFK